MIKFYTIFLMGLLISACTAIPLKTLHKLVTTDPLELEPQTVRTATRMPDWIEPRSNGVKLEFGSQLDGKPVQKETFILQPVPLVLEQQQLALEAKPGFKLYTYRINPNDFARIERLRTRFKAQKAAGKKIKGTMGISVDACRKKELPEKIPVTNYIRLDAKSDYLPLVVDYDLRQSVAVKDLLTLLPPC